jgi:penicillin-binding protein 2
LLEDANGLGFRSRTGIDLPGEITSEFPTGTDYYDRVYGPRRWTSAVTLNLAIGQGENAQTLVNMIRFYQMLASDGRARSPYLAHPSPGPDVSLGLAPDQLAGLRQAMISVVERGTARGAGRFGGSISIAGKTGTAQNPHGPAHGWFIGFAPAEKPEIVVGAIVEFAREGPYVAPLVTRVIGHYLGVDTTVASHVRIILPTDTAPHPMQLLPSLPGEDSTITPLVPFDTTTVPDTVAPADTNPPEAHAPAAPRDR